ncbi:glycosyltransferase [Rhizomicrobium sp. SCGC AG-212-E05]|nr:glycosyltransferase [Rhizomicrobium sp. SCGC AG-212-E05]
MTSRVSVIVPAYNEENTILQILREIRKQSVTDVEFEVVVIDDGSRDRTVALLESSPELYDKLVKQPKNGGKGAAVLAGLRVATGDFILFQDADLEYSPSHYAMLLFPVQNFGAQIVMGSRFLAAPYSRVQFFWHKVGNKLVTHIFNILFNTTFTDIYTCYLLYRRDLLKPEELVSTGWEQHAEILCRVVPRARVVYEVPVSYHGRSYDEGKKIRARDAIPVIWTIIRRRLGRSRSMPA